MTVIEIKRTAGAGKFLRRQALSLCSRRSKTGRRIVLPLVPSLADYLASLPVSDKPNAFISLTQRARSARPRCRISSGMFLLPLDLLSRDRADTKARAKGATNRAKRARFYFTRYAIQR
jgi:hypothetical protein